MVPSSILGLLNSNLSGGHKILGSSATLTYQSANQVGTAIPLNVNIKIMYCAVATVNYTGAGAINKVSRVCPHLQNDVDAISLFAYSDANAFVDGDTVTVSWLIIYD